MQFLDEDNEIEDNNNELHLNSKFSKKKSKKCED